MRAGRAGRSSGTAILQTASPACSENICSVDARRGVSLAVQHALQFLRVSLRLPAGSHRGILPARPPLAAAVPGVAAACVVVLLRLVEAGVRLAAGRLDCCQLLAGGMDPPPAS